MALFGSMEKAETINKRLRHRNLNLLFDAPSFYKEIFSIKDCGVSGLLTPEGERSHSGYRGKVMQVFDLLKDKLKVDEEITFHQISRSRLENSTDEEALIQF